MLAGRSNGAASVAIILMAQIGLVSATAANCPVFPTTAFEPAAARRQMKCTRPSSIGAAQQPVGYILINDLATVSSSGANCDKELEELKVSVTPQAGFLNIGNSSCSLLGVVLTKSDDTAAATVDMRLDFDSCLAGPRKASVVMNVAQVPDTATTPSMMPFFNQVCTQQIKKPEPVLTKTALSFAEVSVGNSTCVGKPIQSYPNVDKTQCKELCIAEVEAHVTELKTSKDMCRGYSFDAFSAAGANVCNLFKGDDDTLTVSKVSDAAGKAGVNCWSLTAQAHSFGESTSPPPTKQAISAMEAMMPKLNVTFAAAGANILTFASADKCFQPFNWITLQDSFQNTVAVSVKTSEWASLLLLIPSGTSARKLATADDLTATIYADRAAYGVAPAPTLAPVPAGPVGPPKCVAEAAPVPSMTMTFVLATLVAVAGAGGFFVGKGFHTALLAHPTVQGAMQHPAVQGAMQHPAAQGAMQSMGVQGAMNSKGAEPLVSAGPATPPNPSMGPPTSTTEPVGLSTTASNAPPAHH